MENTDLKEMWQKAHIQKDDKMSDGISVEEMIKMNHCKTISQVLSDIKLRILLYTLILSIFIGLMLYAFVYLGIHFTISSIVPFSLVGLFLLVSTTMEVNRLIVFTRNADNLSVQQSQNYFRRKLRQIKTIDFLSYLILLYLLAINVIRGYIQDIGGIRNLSDATVFQPILVIFLPYVLLRTTHYRTKNHEIILNES